MKLLSKINSTHKRIATAITVVLIIGFLGLFITRQILIPSPVSSNVLISNGIPAYIVESYISNGMIDLRGLSIAEFVLGIVFVVFFLFVGFFNVTAMLTGLSYNEVNILLWYVVVPFSWLFLLDRVFKFRKFSLTILGLIAYSILGLLSIGNFSHFSNVLFDLSVDFMYFFKIIGWNYYEASVYVCVVLPLIIYVVLGFFAYRNNKVKNEWTLQSL